MIVLLLASGVVSIIMGQFDDAFSITVVSNRGNSLIKLDLVSGPHFHYWIDYDGVAFSLEFLEWNRIFLG